MRVWNDKSKNNSVRNGLKRLPKVSRTSAPDGDSERNDMVSQRGGDSTWTASEGFSGSVQSSTSDSQFIGGTCQVCRHPKQLHFIATDEIGTWSFCSLSICECFVDEPKENGASENRPV